MSYRALVDCYEAKVSHDWDQTATLAAITYNLACVIQGTAGKVRIRPKSLCDFHPYRRKPRRGLKLQAKDIGVLRVIGDVLAGRQ